jgi:Rab11 family-interacting protein 1/2/5
VLTCLHHNNFGMDEFLGQVMLPLNQMDQFERPRSRWYKLLSKPGQEKKEKDRGEIEVRTAFTVKAGSLSDLSKKEKNKSSLSNIAGGVGGSLLSLGTLEKRKSLKKFAKSLGSKMHVTGKKKKEKSDDSDSYSGSFSSIGTPSMGIRNNRNMSGIGNADPGVISEDEDEFVFDNLSHKSSGSSLNVRQKANNLIIAGSEDLSPSKTSITSATLPPLKPPRNPIETPTKDAKVDEWEAKLYGKSLDLGPGSTDSLKRRSWENSRVPLNTDENMKEKEREPTIAEQSFDRISLSSSPTAPSTPQLVKRSQLESPEPRPRPLPRSNTAAEPIVNLDVPSDDKPNMSPISLKTEKHEKADNIFSKKWNKFKRELTPVKHDEQLKNQYNKTSAGNGGERIIIGGEFNHQSFTEKKVEVSKEILAKYDGKSKEVRTFEVLMR